MRTTALLTLTVLGTLFVVAPRGAEPTAAELAASVQKKYDGVHSFSTDFTHTYRGGALRKELTEKGRLLVMKPGKMRWNYLSPEDKVFISDGLKVYSYIPADKQVIVGSVPSDDTATTPALFLAGKGNVTRDFSASLAKVPPGWPAGTKALKLVPRKPQPDYDWLVLLLDPATLSLRGLLTSDAQGGTSSFVFSNLKENVTLSDKDFAFMIPRGVDVVTDGGKR